MENEMIPFLLAARVAQSTTPPPASTPLPIATPVPGAQSPHSATFDPGTGVAWAVYGLLALAFLVVIAPLILRLMRAPAPQRAQAGVQQEPQDFFQLPYAMWYSLHYSIAALALIFIAILGLTGTITGEVIASLIGSLLGYVLGSVSSRQAAG